MSREFVENFPKILCEFRICSQWLGNSPKSVKKNKLVLLLELDVDDELLEVLVLVLVEVLVVVLVEVLVLVLVLVLVVVLLEVAEMKVRYKLLVFSSSSEVFKYLQNQFFLVFDLKSSTTIPLALLLLCFFYSLSLACHQVLFVVVGELAIQGFKSFLFPPNTSFVNREPSEISFFLLFTRPPL